MSSDRKSSGGLSPGVGFFAIMFTDIVASTDHRARFGDVEAGALHAEVDRITREVVERNRGSVVKGLGDGVMALFGVPTDAVNAGVAIQRRLARRNRGAVVPLDVRVGITVGEVDVTADDVFGYAVNEASRLCGAADSGGILIGEMASNLARRAEVDFGPAVSVAITPSAPPAVALPVIFASRDKDAVSLATPIASSVPGGRFVGRADELDSMLEQWRATIRGETQLCVLSGEPGQGKTSLLGHFAREVVEGSGIVLYGRCDERTSAPYQPFADAFSHLVANWPATELDSLLHDSLAELGRLVPSLAERMGSASANRYSDLESERWRLQDSVVAALHSLSEFEPVLLIVDDLHWAGATTLDLLDRILRSAVNERLMVVLALRTWDPGTDPHVGQLLADRHRRPQPVLDVHLRGLEPGEVGELVAEWKQRGDVDAAETTELWEITAGNPLFVSQVLRTTTDEEVVPRRLPQGVIEVIERQLERLSPPTLGLMRTAALIGTSFELQVATEAASLSRTTALECLDEATGAGFVQALQGTPLRYEFAHALVRRAIEDQLGEGRRRDLHARIAAALEAAPTANTDERVRRLAFHWSEAGEMGDPAKGVATGCAAAELAIQHLAIADALELLDRVDALAALAPDELRRSEIKVLRAEAMCLGAFPDARAEQLGAFAAATEAGDAHLMARAALAHSRNYFSSYGRKDAERVQSLQAALEVCDPTDDATRALVMARLANELTFEDTEHRRFDLVDDALELARNLRDESILAAVLNHRQYVMGGPAFLDDRLREGLEMAEIATRTRDRLLEMHSCRLLCAATTEVADFDQVDHFIARLGELNEALDLPAAKWEFASVRASRALVAGDLRHASAMVKEAFALGAAAGQSDAFVFAGAQLMHLNYLRGRLPSIMDTFLSATPAEVTTPLVAWVARQLHVAGRVEEAQQWWRRALDTGLDAQVEVGVNAGLVLNSWAFMASVSESDDEVIAMLRERLSPYGERLFNQLAPDQPGHHFLGLLADAAGDHDQCDQHFHSSLVLLERIDAPVMAAITGVAWGSSLARRGQRDRAQELAASARAAASLAGAAHIEREATELLEGDP